jgi:integrase
MALKMPSPWNRSGHFYFRLRVPVDLVPLVGKTLIVRSLDTQDPKLAKQRFAVMLAAIGRQWERLKAQSEVPAFQEPDKLKLKDVLGLAGEFYRWMVAKHDSDPGAAARWLEEVESDRRIISPKGLNGRPRLGSGPSLYMPMVQKFLEERGIIVGEGHLFDIAREAAYAGLLAKERLARAARGDYSDDPAAARFPKWEEVELNFTIKSKTLTLVEHYDEFAKTRSAASRKKYRSCLQDLERFLGNPNLAVATPDDIQNWVDNLASRMVVKDDKEVRKIGDKNIADGYLAAARSFFKWGVRKKKIARNPAADIRHEFPMKPQVRKPYFTDKEIKLILSEALRAPSGRESPQFAAAKRWAPWMCAYTGARVNEITQLRGMDVWKRDYEGEVVWTINITPDAGPVKDNRAREVPLHEHLAAQGFIDFVKASGDGPLFYDPARRLRREPDVPQGRRKDRGVGPLDRRSQRRGAEPWLATPVQECGAAQASHPGNPRRDQRP